MQSIILACIPGAAYPQLSIMLARAPIATYPATIAYTTSCTSMLSMKLACLSLILCLCILPILDVAYISSNIVQDIV